MRIDGYSLAMTAQSKTVTVREREESMRMWMGNGGERLPRQEDNVAISGEAATLPAASKSNGRPKSKEKIKLQISEKDRLKLFLVQKMLEMLTGKKIRFYLPEEMEIDGLQGNPDLSGGVPKAPEEEQGPNGWGLEYSYREVCYERQTLSFRSNGIIRTADGREIDFSLELNMSRELASYFGINVKMGDAAKDPLVINFNGIAPELTGEEISFDLDCDGTENLLPFPAPTSGFLALDLNGDGIINNGGELFGPASGNGFAELSQYDEDGNRWIDENDPIFEKLRIWVRDENGNNVLFALGQKGIGAIFLGNISTYFKLAEEQGEARGTIRKTGIFVRENGSGGTVQHIDLVL